MVLYYETTMKLAIAQINATLGDIDGNTAKIISFIQKARRLGAKLVAFPELTITGYPPKDLLLKPAFVWKNKTALRQIIPHTKTIAVIVGFVDHTEANLMQFKEDGYDVSALTRGKRPLYNAAALIYKEKIRGIQHKKHLPTYDVFDEKRYFEPAKESQVFQIGALKLGINICEDIWVDDGPTSLQAELGADLIINISSSPFYVGKTKIRRKLVAKRARENKTPIAYVNLVGGQDDLVFDGSSLFCSARGKVVAKCKDFQEELKIVNIKSNREAVVKENPTQCIHDALVLGIRDYVIKNGFSKVVIGLSGGIDSALITALAVKALGPRNVLCLGMPSRVSSPASEADARLLAKNLDVKYKVIPIDDTYQAYLDTLASEFKGLPRDTAEENIQARIRGNILMAMSNKFGYFVLSTGNKSELAVGYTTLYGDLAGGLAVLSDVPKTTVYKLARFINKTAGKKLIPQKIITKAPSAELRVGQKDSDDLPPYPVLDKILHYYIEENKSAREIIKLGFKPKLVKDIIYRVDHSEYKRQQAPIGIKITPKAFGFGRRMPITNQFSA